MTKKNLDAEAYLTGSLAAEQAIVRRIDDAYPSGHGHSNPLYPDAFKEATFRIEQAYRRGFSQALSAIRQHWDSHPPADLRSAVRDVEKAESWAMNLRWRMSRHPREKPWMMDLLWKKLAKRKPRP